MAQKKAISSSRSQLGERGGEKIETYCDGEDVALGAEGHEDGARPAAAAVAAAGHRRLARFGHLGAHVRVSAVDGPGRQRESDIGPYTAGAGCVVCVARSRSGLFLLMGRVGPVNKPRFSSFRFSSIQKLNSLNCPSLSKWRFVRKIANDVVK